MAADWYQSSAWDETAQADFRARLARARTQRLFYLGQKASAIAELHPESALALFAEKIAQAEYEDEIVPALHAQAMIHFRCGNHVAMFAALERAIAVGGEFTAIAAIADYCSAVGLLRDAARYEQAMAWLDHLDAHSQAQRGRGLGAFGTLAARALITWQIGRRDDAEIAAAAALRLSVSDGPVTGHPNIGAAPRPPSPIHDRLLVIAGMWDEAALGPPPEP